jgi:hypothetical protein
MRLPTTFVEEIRATSLLTIVLIASAAGGCTRRAPPAPEGIDPTVAALPPPSDAPRNAIPDAAHGGAGSPLSAPLDTTSAVDRLDSGVDPGTLPQTKDKPSSSPADGGSPTSDEAFALRSSTLWEAIVRDEPDRAMPFFFPVTAYEQVKAIPSPASDWRRRLVTAFKRDVHGLNKRLGDKAAAAKLVRLDVPNDRARWVEPNEESNRLGYWRVYGTRIIYQFDGKERSLEISSLISWRGEWYVVHLTGFK